MKINKIIKYLEVSKIKQCPSCRCCYDFKQIYHTYGGDIFLYKNYINEFVSCEYTSKDILNSQLGFVTTFYKRHVVLPKIRKHSKHLKVRYNLFDLYNNKKHKLLRYVIYCNKCEFQKEYCVWLDG